MSSQSGTPFSGFSALDTGKRAPDLGGLSSGQFASLARMIDLFQASPAGLTGLARPLPAVPASATAPDPDPFDLDGPDLTHSRSSGMRFSVPMAEQEAMVHRDSGTLGALPLQATATQGAVPAMATPLCSAVPLPHGPVVSMAVPGTTVEAATLGALGSFEAVSEPVFALHPDPGERIGDDSDDDGELETSTKLPLTYFESISMLRDRLGSGICPPLPEPTVQGGASALDFFRDKDVHMPSPALPQCRKVQSCLSDLTDRLQGEGVGQGRTLPYFPKALAVGKFPTLNKPKVFQPHSYEVHDPTLVVGPPPVDPSFREVLRQGSTLPVTQAVSFQTLEGWERLARAGIQISSHSELFLCGVLSALSMPASEDRLREVTKYLQVMATAQSHTMEILTRLASGPLLARRDAYLARSCLDDTVKASLRVQPIESRTLFGPKFEGAVKAYKEDLAHTSLQRAAAVSVPRPKKPVPLPRANIRSSAKPPGTPAGILRPTFTASPQVSKPTFKRKAYRGKPGRKGNQK